MKALNLTAPGVKRARQLPQLKGKKPIGRGTFSALFDGERPDTVLKLTVDSTSYWMSNCCAAGCAGPHFPRVVRNHRDVGEVTVRGVTYPIFLYEVERLERLKTGGEAARQFRVFKSIAKQATTACSSIPNREAAPAVMEMMADLAAKADLPGSLRHAISDLSNFVRAYDDVFIDIHRANVMQDSEGTLVINDPVGQYGLFMSLRTGW